MKQSTIQFKIDLDEKKMPVRIAWEASDNPEELSETKSVSIALWDHIQNNTLRIDLWTKEMLVNDMKKFYIDCIGGLAQSILTSTKDEYMANEINQLCEKLVEHVKK